MTTKMFILVIIMFVWRVCVKVFMRIVSMKRGYVMVFMCIVTLKIIYSMKCDIGIFWEHRKMCKVSVCTF